MNFVDNTLFLILDTINPHAIRTWIKHHQGIIDYTAEHYAFFAGRRSQLMDELKQSLLYEQKKFEFSQWRRIVSNQYSNTPLSTTGSVLSFPGGRFNIGIIDERFPQFPALYIAEDTETAYLESMGLRRTDNIAGLTANELAAAGNFSHYNIRGSLTQILDLTILDSVKGFYEIINNIQLPIYYRHEASRLKINPMNPVNSLAQLHETILNENWRLMPMQFDVPANSQILGQIARAAGLEGILYPSTITGHKSIAVFPDNFKNSEAYIEIEGKTANTVINKKIDQNTYQLYLPTP
jgi:hypothetical protein